MKERLHYIDIAKGLLILLVIYDHLTDMYLYSLKLHNNYISELNNWQWIYKLFFMPAFFAITGMCSNFDKPFIPFIKNNFKSLIVPNIIIGILLSPHIILLKLWGAILYGGTFWFLSALFVAKIIYWLLHKYLQDKVVWRVFILLLLTLIGFAFNVMPEKYDFWYFHYAFSLIIFLEIGILIKHGWSNILIYMSLAVYIIVCIYLYLSGAHKPVVALGSNCQMMEIPLYLIAASSGTILMIWCSMLISKNKILEYFGKESLVFYVFQFFVMTEIEIIYLRFFPISDYASTLLFVLIVYVLTVLVLSLISYIVEMRHFRFVLGKY